MTELEERLTKLEETLGGFRILGGSDVLVSGGLPLGGYTIQRLPCPPKEGAGEEPELGVGACCFDDFCYEDTEENCSGEFLGEGTTCDDDCPVGACCDEGTCYYLSDLGCENIFGVFQGLGSSCDPNPCERACCFPDATCEDLSASDCEFAGGIVSSDGPDCGSVDCPLLGACCDFDGSCFQASEADCSFGGAQWFEGVSCEENPCTTGACCLDEFGSCDDSTTESYCSYIGGSYAGDDTSCDDDVCPYCPEYYLECDSIQATKAKCGFLNPADNKYYHTLTTTHTASGIYTTGGHCGTHGSGTTVHVAYSWTQVRVQNCPDDECNECTDDCTVSGGLTVSFEPLNPGDEDACAGYCTFSGSIGASCNAPADTPYALGFNNVGPGFFYVSIPGCGRVVVGNPAPSHSYTDEYTTAELISNVEDDLPPFAGTFECSGGEPGQGCNCYAFRNLTEDEVSYSIGRFQYKWVFFGGVGPFTLNWDEVGPDGINVMVYGGMGGDGESGIYEVDEPSVNGTTDIENDECIPG